MRSLLLVESFNFRPSNQYILVRVIPSFFRMKYTVQMALIAIICILSLLKIGSGIQNVMGVIL
jgi:hypothetical protein